MTNTDTNDTEAFLPTVYGDLPPIKTAEGNSINGYPIHIANSPTGPKFAVLRLPAAEELLDWFAQQKDVIKPLGRGASEEESIPTPKADRKLFGSIRIDAGDGAVEFDDAEALWSISQLTRHRVDRIERDGESFIVTLTTLFDVVTTHTVRIPYVSEQARYQKDVVKVKSLANGYAEQRINVLAACNLYDKIVQKTTGYRDGAPIPPHHKRTVIVKVMTEIALLDSSLDPNS
jgi:hypothetical protein